MSRAFSPDDLAAAIRGRLLSFPLTDFDEDDAFDPRAYRARVAWLNEMGASGHFAAGGAGEFFSLTTHEYGDVVRATVDVCGGRVPVIAAIGMGTLAAVSFARTAAELGADGLLLLPPYMTESSQAGLAKHVEAVCRASDLGVIVYNRANCRLTAATLAGLAERCPTLIGLKDGLGDIEQLVAMRSLLGKRMLLINGMPTAEIYAQAYAGMGVPTYSSALFNFIPKAAQRFHAAVAAGDLATVDAFLRDFLLPYMRIRNAQPGYAVSIVKAGADIIGRGAGRVRSPLSDLEPDERAALSTLILAIKAEGTSR